MTGCLSGISCNCILAFLCLKPRRVDTSAFLVLLFFLFPFPCSLTTYFVLILPLIASIPAFCIVKECTLGGTRKLVPPAKPILPQANGRGRSLGWAGPGRHLPSGRGKGPIAQALGTCLSSFLLIHSSRALFANLEACSLRPTSSNSDHCNAVCIPAMATSQCRSAAEIGLL